MALACLHAPSAKASSDEVFEGYSQVLNRMWRDWQKSCPKPQLPSSIDSLSESDATQSELRRYDSCLVSLSERIERRREAQPLVTPTVWAELTQEQQGMLQGDLERANREVLREMMVQADALHSAKRALDDTFVQKQEATFASVSEVRACARRRQTLEERIRAMDGDESELKSMELQLEMQRTRLIGMDWMASKSDYNQAVNQFNYIVDTLRSKASRYNSKLASWKKDGAQWQEDCEGLKVNKATYEAVCSSSDYAAYCRAFNKN